MIPKLRLRRATFEVGEKVAVEGAILAHDVLHRFVSEGTLPEWVLVPPGSESVVPGAGVADDVCLSRDVHGKAPTSRNPLEHFKLLR